MEWWVEAEKCERRRDEADDDTTSLMSLWIALLKTYKTYNPVLICFNLSLMISSCESLPILQLELWQTPPPIPFAKCDGSISIVTPEGKIPAGSAILGKPVPCKWLWWWRSSGRLLGWITRASKLRFFNLRIAPRIRPNSCSLFISRRRQAELAAKEEALDKKLHPGADEGPEWRKVTYPNQLPTWMLSRVGHMFFCCAVIPQEVDILTTILLLTTER